MTFLVFATGMCGNCQEQATVLPINLPAMVVKTYYIMLQGKGPALLEKVVHLLPQADVLWAGSGDAQIEPSRLLPPTHRGVSPRGVHGKAVRLESGPASSSESYPQQYRA